MPEAFALRVAHAQKEPGVYAHPVMPITWHVVSLTIAKNAHLMMSFAAASARVTNYQNCRRAADRLDVTAARIQTVQQPMPSVWDFVKRGNSQDFLTAADHLVAIAVVSQNARRQTRFVGVCVQVKNCHRCQMDVDRLGASVVETQTVRGMMQFAPVSASMVNEQNCLPVAGHLAASVVLNSSVRLMMSFAHEFAMATKCPTFPRGVVHLVVNAI